MAQFRLALVTKTFIDSGKTSQIVEIYPEKNVPISEKHHEKDTPIKVRLLRIELPNAEVELLITSLLNNKVYPHKAFKKL